MTEQRKAALRFILQLGKSLEPFQLKILLFLCLFHSLFSTEGGLTSTNFY